MRQHCFETMESYNFDMLTRMLHATSQTYTFNHESKKFFKLELTGIFTKILVTVSNRIVFSCESNVEKVASEHCANLNVDLQKIRGNLILYAKPFDIGDNIAQCKAELYVFTERAVSFNSSPPWLSSNVHEKTRRWAADGLVSVNTAVFKNKRIFSQEHCEPCPRNIICNEP